MSLYLKQTETQSELQKRIAAELQDKAKKKAMETELPDGVTDSAYLKDTSSTGRLAWLWITLAVVIIGVVIWIIVATL